MKVTIEAKSDGYKESFDDECGKTGGDGLVGESRGARLTSGESENGKETRIGEMSNETGDPSADDKAVSTGRIRSKPVVDAIIDTRADEYGDDAGDKNTT